MGVMCKRTWISLGGGLLWAIALSACGALPATSVDKKGASAAVDSSVVQSLQRQVRERDKRIADLESQLNALRVIDQDMEKRRTSSRSPATLTPSAADQPR
jgi:TolA-binding protein